MSVVGSYPGLLARLVILASFSPRPDASELKARKLQKEKGVVLRQVKPVSVKKVSKMAKCHGLEL